MNGANDFNLDSDQRTRLLKIGLSASSPNVPEIEPDEKRTDHLYKILISTLPIAEELRTSLPQLITGQVQDLVSISGKPIGELIRDRQTDIATLRKIKDHCKQYGTAVESQEEQDAFKAVYFAAIASALISHGKKISHHRDRDLRSFFDSFLKKAWIIEELRTIFEKTSHHGSGNSESKGD